MICFVVALLLLLPSSLLLLLLVDSSVLIELSTLIIELLICRAISSWLCCCNCLFDLELLVRALM